MCKALPNFSLYNMELYMVLPFIPDDLKTILNAVEPLKRDVELWNLDLLFQYLGIHIYVVLNLKWRLSNQYLSVNFYQDSHSSKHKF